MNFYKNSVIALTLSIISVSGALMYQSFMSNRVLGESIGGSGSYYPTMAPKPTYIVTITPQPTSQPIPNNICADLKVLSTKYCSVSPTPTIISDTPCKSVYLTSQSYYQMGTVCTVDVYPYSAVSYTCSDGYSGKTSYGKCTTTSILKSIASKACSARSTCGQY